MCSTSRPGRTSIHKVNQHTDALHYCSHIAVVALVRLLVFGPLWIPQFLLDVLFKPLQYARQALSTALLLLSTLFNLLRIVCTRRPACPPAVWTTIAASFLQHATGRSHPHPYTTLHPQACFRCLQADKAPIRVCCSGGGIFFFWQLGTLQWLQRAGRLDHAHFVGYSAGALSATMAVCGVDLQTAVDAAYETACRARVWDKPLGLLGVWKRYDGMYTSEDAHAKMYTHTSRLFHRATFPTHSMVREWLEELLPPDAAVRAHGRLYIVATHLPSLQPHVFANFTTREALIDALCASIHVPWLLDCTMSTAVSPDCHECRIVVADHTHTHARTTPSPSPPTTNVYVDGHISMALLGRGVIPPGMDWPHGKTLVVDHLTDDQLGISMWEFLSLMEYETVLRIMASGEAYAQRTWGDGCARCSGDGGKAVGEQVRKQSCPAVVMREVELIKVPTVLC